MIVSRESWNWGDEKHSKRQEGNVSGDKHGVSEFPRRSELSPVVSCKYTSRRSGQTV